MRNGRNRPRIPAMGSLPLTLAAASLARRLIMQQHQSRAPATRSLRAPFSLGEPSFINQLGAFTVKVVRNASLAASFDNQKMNLTANWICRSGIVVLVSKPADPLRVPSDKKMSLSSGTVGGAKLG